MENAQHRFTHFLGADLAKAWIDLALTDAAGRILEEQRVKNTAARLAARFKLWQQKHGFSPETVLICAENTGLYTSPLRNFALENQKIKLWIEHPARIAHCTGPVRGVNDRLAAERITRYARRYADEFKPWQPAAALCARLQNFASMRKRLIVQRGALKTPLNELAGFKPALAADIQGPAQSIVNEIEKQIKGLDAQIESLLAEDPAIQRQSEILRSIPGVGKVCATAVIIATQRFTRFDNARQFACFCGLAPFEQSSGSSVRKRPRVSHQADKRLKSLLQMAPSPPRVYKRAIALLSFSSFERSQSPASFQPCHDRHLPFKLPPTFEIHLGFYFQASKRKLKTT